MIGGFKGLGWIVSFAVVAPCFYMVSSTVAAERGRVEAVERAILQAKKDIRGLETEFDTRANHEQLERWNGDVLALSAPRPGQYLAADTQLAGLSLEGRGEGAQRLAGLVVPAGTPQIVTVAAVTAPAPAKAAAAPAPALQKAVVIESAPATPRARLQKVAMVDSDILSDRTFSDLMHTARAETATR